MNESSFLNEVRGISTFKLPCTFGKTTTFLWMFVCLETRLVTCFVIMESILTKSVISELQRSRRRKFLALSLLRLRSARDIVDPMMTMMTWIFPVNLALEISVVDLVLCVDVFYLLVLAAVVIYFISNPYPHHHHHHHQMKTPPSYLTDPFRQRKTRRRRILTLPPFELSASVWYLL